MEVLNSVIPVVSALIGAGVTYFAQTANLQRSRSWQGEDERRRLTVEKGEELYSLVNGWNKLAGSHHLIFRRVMSGELDYNTALEEVIEAGRCLDHPFERIRLLIQVYFPKLVNSFEALEKDLQLGNSVERDFRESYKMGIVDSDIHLKSYDTAFIKAERATAEFLKSLAQEIRSTTALLEDKKREN